MNPNGHRPASVYELHRAAQRAAERDGRPRWVVTIGDTLRIVEPGEFAVAYDHRGNNVNWIERVCYPELWVYRRG